MNFADMIQVSWEHEYFTDDDAAAFETREEAEKFAATLREKGKRRITIFDPSEPQSDDNEDL